ncbi:MAG: hypothetical protein KBI47_10800 [Armatimonadetes bacterium]|nr:hypothetical protein [Armatimonadota bacterium]
MPNPLVIGITGPYGAGRSTAAQHFAELANCDVVKLSEFIRRELGEGEREDVVRLQQKGDEIRSNRGDDALAQDAVDCIVKSGQEIAIVDGIKHPDEASALSEAFLFYLVAVEASVGVCRERTLRSPAISGSVDRFDEISRRDRREVDQWGFAVSHGQQTDACVDLADAIIWNDKAVQDPQPRQLEHQTGDREQLRNKVKGIWQKITESDKEKPSITEVRMCQAYTVAQRSTCPQRKVGALITNFFGSVVAEGYNEVPGKQSSCIQMHGECYRKVVRNQDLSDLAALFSCGKCGGKLGPDLVCLNGECGERYQRRLPPRKNLDYCRAVHAEESAILQVSRFGGIGIENGTLYTTTYPCALCAKKVLQTGLSKVVFMRRYTMEDADDCLIGAELVLEQFEGITPRGFHRLFRNIED